MAGYYVYSGATGAGTGADWTNAYTTLSTAISGKVAGDVFYVASDHVQTQASALTLTLPGTVASPCKILSVNRAGSVPPVAADLLKGASLATTGAFSITMNGHVSECNGLSFSAGSAASNASIFACSSANGASSWRFVNCAFKLNSTNASARIYWPDYAANLLTLENCTVQFGATTQGIGLSGSGTVWRNTPNALVGPTYPTALFRTPNLLAGILCEGIDLSALPGASSVVESTTTGMLNRVVLKDCKLSSATILTPNASNWVNPEAVLIRCDSGNVNYRNERYYAFGTLTTETTVVLTGGATDGTTAISWRFVTLANTKPEMPLEGFPITIWNETVGSAITVTLQGIWGGGSVPNNDDIYMDIEYFGTSGFPLGSRISTNKATTLSANAPLSAGSGTWGGSTTKFQLSATFTPQMKGPLTIYVKAAKASSTFYIDPEPTIT